MASAPSSKPREGCLFQRVEVFALGLRQRPEVIRHRVIQRRIMLVLDLLDLPVLAALRDRKPRIGAADIADQS